MEWYNIINKASFILLFLLQFLLFYLDYLDGVGMVGRESFLLWYFTFYLHIVQYLQLLITSFSCLHGGGANRDDWGHGSSTFLAHETRGSPQVVGSNDEGGHPEGHGDAEGCIDDGVVLTDVLAVESSVLAIASVVHVVVEHGSVDNHHCNWGDPSSEKSPEELIGY